jgi:hypothetical protein
LNVKLEFQYLFEDFKEASLAVRKHAQARESRRLGRKAIVWVLLIAVAVGLLFGLRVIRTRIAPPGPPFPSRSNPTMFQDVILPFLPWLFVFSFVWFFLFRRMRDQYQSAWEKHPDFHRPRVLEIDDDGVTWSDAVSKSRRLWTGYTQWAETKHLILLYRGDLSAEFIPKRAFSDVASVDALRELLSKSISAPQHAFPVIPA